MSAPPEPVTRHPAHAVDASMRLLREVMEQPLDPAYSRAAVLRSAAGRPGRSSVVVTLVIAVLCGWAVTRGVVELRRPVPGLSAGRTALEREIGRRTASADTRQRQIQRLRAEIEVAQQAHLTSPHDAELARTVQQLGVLTGELPVRGPGLEISLQDAPSVDSQGAAVDPRASTSEDGRVLDHDLQIVANGLWAAGAEAIAINGRRLSTLSAIRSAGAAILVDFRPLLPPYRVQAIGDPQQLKAQFDRALAATYVRSLRDNFGVRVSITASQDLRLPGAGSLQLHRAGVTSTGAPASASGRSAAGSPAATDLTTVTADASAGVSGSPSSTEVRP
ncbi:MAG TPA: DUF881 domain-containing protein [Kineosporiaceae bacterium]